MEGAMVPEMTYAAEQVRERIYHNAQYEKHCF